MLQTVASTRLLEIWHFLKFTLINRLRKKNESIQDVVGLKPMFKGIFVWKKQREIQPKNKASKFLKQILINKL